MGGIHLFVQSHMRPSAQTDPGAYRNVLPMSHLFAMQRANGDFFALDDRGRFRVPLFPSSRDAMVARSRNVEMLLFKPVALNSRLLRELVPAGGISEVDFWLVKDPLISLNRGTRIERAELASRMN